MSRRGRSGPTISLFSFQDIITSVTAIVTVITLLLALDLVQRKKSQSSDSSSALAIDLASRLERAETELAQLQTVAAATDELVREVASISPADLKHEISGRESRIATLEQEKRRLEELAVVWRSREKEELAEQFDLEPLKDELVHVEKSLEDVVQKRTEEQTENRTIFSLPRGMQKDGWIAEIDLQQILVAPMGRPAKPTTFVATGLPLVGSSATDNFEKWIDDHQLNSAYFLVLIRPEATATAYPVQQLLERKRISHGYDLIDANQMILHPERGAAP